jgi:hypothetical protein
MYKNLSCDRLTGQNIRKKGEIKTVFVSLIVIQEPFKKKYYLSQNVTLVR